MHTQYHRELKTPPAPLHLWEGKRVWYVEFVALQLACTPGKRPKTKVKVSMKKLRCLLLLIICKIRHS